MFGQVDYKTLAQRGEFFDYYVFYLAGHLQQSIVLKPAVCLKVFMWVTFFFSFQQVEAYCEDVIVKCGRMGALSSAKLEKLLNNLESFVKRYPDMYKAVSDK